MVIEMEHVRKSYRSVRGRRTVAIDDLTMSVPSGGVHGFLGPNGSGKTTTIRILLGLIGADAGRVRVLDAEVPTKLPDVVGRVGALVETPQLFPGFSGRRNLTILARLAQLPPSRVDELLTLVGLAERADDRVKGYSLGMRQRLAIAAALLKSPELLILDEPTNGLDPAGMVEVRELIRRLGREGRTTVFLSSHLLGEIEAVCDSVTILRRGRLVASGPVGTVLTAAGAPLALGIVVPMGQQSAAIELLKRSGIQSAMAGEGLKVESSDGAQINQILGAAGIWASEIRQERPDLERAFLDLTANEETR